MDIDSKYWDSEDAAALKLFLKSPAGRRMRFVLDTLLKPVHAHGYDPNARIVCGAQIEGYEACLANLLALTTDQEHSDIEVKNNYPDLDDDEAWVKMLKKEADQNLTDKTSGVEEIN